MVVLVQLAKKTLKPLAQNMPCLLSQVVVESMVANIFRFHKAKAGHRSFWKVKALW